MKSTLFAACVLVFAATFTSGVFAKELKEYQVEADQYYAQGNYKKAFKGYFKLAKIGDHYSQYWVANMYANGEGKKTDLKYAYAWSVLAAESGREKLIRNSEELLDRNADKKAAQKKAERLMKKYGVQALEEKAELLAKRESGRRFGSCTGSRLSCQNASGYGAPITPGNQQGPVMSAGER